MLEAGFYNMDCMEALKEFPDGFFDLAVVDPPYGIDIGHKPERGNTNVSRSAGKVIGGGYSVRGASGKREGL